MDKINQFIAYVESDEIRVMLNVVNSVNSFISAIKYKDIFVKAHDEVLSDLEVNTDVLKKRINMLLQIEADAHYLHPYDVSLACYLLLVAKSNRTQLKDIFSHIKEKNLPNLWWTNAIMQRLSEELNLEKTVETNILMENVRDFNIQEININNNSQTIFV
jgi:hypothetical protein